MLSDRLTLNKAHTRYSQALQRRPKGVRTVSARLSRRLVYIIHIIQSRKTLTQCNVNSKVTESKQSRLCERVGRRDVRASRSTRKVSRSVRKVQGRRRGHGGRGSLGRAGGSFSEGGRGARQSASDKFWKIRHYRLPIYIFSKISYKASRQLFRQAFRGHSDSYPISIPSIDVRKLSSYLS